MRDSSVAVVVFFTLGFGTLDAQSPLRVKPGHRIRVQTLSSSGSFDRGVKGVVEQVLGDTLLLIHPDGDGPEIQVHARDYRVRLLAFSGRRSSIGRGAAVGAFLGTAGGAVVGLGFAKPCPPPVSADDPACIEGGPEALKGAAVGLGGGLAIGMVIGSLLPREVWTGVPGFPAVGLTFPARRRGAGLGVSVEF